LMAEGKRSGLPGWRGGTAAARATKANVVDRPT